MFLARRVGPRLRMDRAPRIRTRAASRRRSAGASVFGCAYAYVYKSHIGHITVCSPRPRSMDVLPQMRRPSNIAPLPPHRPSFPAHGGRPGGPYNMGPPPPGGQAAAPPPPHGLPLHWVWCMGEHEGDRRARLRKSTMREECKQLKYMAHCASSAGPSACRRPAWLGGMLNFKCL